jgi:hypothetical protein
VKTSRQDGESQTSANAARTRRDLIGGSDARIIMSANEAAATGSQSLKQPIRLSNQEHYLFITNQPCVTCGRSSADARHIRFAQPRALGPKVSDKYTAPVCRTHHRELRRCGDEASCWGGRWVGASLGVGDSTVSRLRSLIFHQ